MDPHLSRPDHLDDATWDAIESHRVRVERAVALGDRPAVVGAAKELVEAVSRSAISSSGMTLGDNAKFPAVVETAHKALKASPGDLGGQPAVKQIAQGALSMVKAVNEIRNDVGTGHGRSYLLTIDDEMLEAVIAASMLWCRWALARLGGLLNSQANTLISAVHSAISLDHLRERMLAVKLPTQEREEQRAIGVAFGQEAGGGFGNAYKIGVKPVAGSADLSQWPTDYRIGLAEGFLINWEGKIGLHEHSVDDFVDVLVPVSEERVRMELETFTTKVQNATWMEDWRGAPVDPAKVVAALRSEGERLPTGLQDTLNALCSALSKSALGEY